MKKITVAIAALLLGTAASYADSDFDGMYAGVSGGYGTVEADGLGEDKNFSGSAFVGYGATFGSLYVGAEAGAGIDGTELSSGGVTLERDWTFGATGKVGYVVTPKVLAYGLAGWERAEISIGGADESQDGLRFGAGVETIVKENLSVRSEVSYTDWKADGAAPASDDLRTNVGVAVRF